MSRARLRPFLVAALITCSTGLAQTDAPWRAGAYHLARGDYRRAIASLQGIKGNDSSVENMRGVAQMMAGDFEAAGRSFAAALRDDPKSATARFNRGILSLKKQSWSEAAADFAAVYETGGALRAAAAYHHALADQGRGDLAAAGVWFSQALKADPSFDDALLALGTVRERSSQFQEAGRLYRDYLDRHPDSVVAMLRFGVCAQATGNIEVANRYLRQVIEKRPDSAEATEARKFLFMWSD